MVMKSLIKKILKENDDMGWANDLVKGQELPFRIVGQTKPPPMKKNLFVMKGEWMSGDADAYNTETTTYREDRPKDMEWFIIACRVYKILLNDRWGYHDWDDLNELLNPHGFCVYTRRGECDGLEVTDFIRRDVMSDGQFPARLESLDIKYYDANGIEHDVVLT